MRTNGLACFYSFSLLSLSVKIGWLLILSPQTTFEKNGRILVKIGMIIMPPEVTNVERNGKELMSVGTYE
jgi:hypothetical protein